MNYRNADNQLPYMDMKIPRKKLLELSELFADAMLPLCEALLPKYRKLSVMYPASAKYDWKTSKMIK